jgi:hypothetical protein
VYGDFTKGELNERLIIWAASLRFASEQSQGLNSLLWQGSLATVLVDGLYHAEGMER